MNKFELFDKFQSIRKSLEKPLGNGFFVSAKLSDIKLAAEKQFEKVNFWSVYHPMLIFVNPAVDIKDGHPYLAFSGDDAIVLVHIEHEGQMEFIAIGTTIEEAQQFPAAFPPKNLTAEFELKPKA